ncbi:hypothetical protein Fot_15019 [Forsythia ovata]|uniref:Uncharacterized protein n=1 Tax=Forsythia ovata TaxID=205694 RepID=A0ABD1W7Y9_9LAMI
MAGFYFSRVPKLKIRSGRVVDNQGDISPQPPVPRTTSVLEVVVLQASEAIADVSSTVPSASRIVVGVSAVLPPEEFPFSSEDIRRLDKRRMVANEKGKFDLPRRGTQGDRDARDSRKAKRGREAPSWRAGEHAPRSRGTARTSIPPSGWSEHINIGSHQDELDPAILGKLSSLSATAAASIYKYWTSVWERTTEGTDLSELIKMAGMNTAQSHVLNCELYKVLEMNVDDLRSTVAGANDIDAMRLENQIIHSELAIFEDVRARAMYDVTKSGTI